MYIGINKFSASASVHKPLHAFRIQHEVAYIIMHLTSHYVDTFKLNAYVSQFYFSVINKVARYTV